MKNEKAIYKYTHDGHIGFMHYVIFEKQVVVLSKIESHKIAFINDNGYLLITANIKGSDYQQVPCKVVEDKDFVERVYQYMIETNNAYFKDGTDDLCAVIFDTK